jgi:hypothetical protein
MVEGHIQTQMYQMQLLHREFVQPIECGHHREDEHAHASPCPCGSV